jgi:hypothetical protein
MNHVNHPETTSGARVMKPKPRSELNVFTVPVAPVLPKAELPGRSEIDAVPS